MSGVIVKRFKVLLLSYPGAPAPPTFDVNFIRTLFFGADCPPQTPLPDSRPLGTTAAQYFFSVSDSYLRVVGDVINWVNSPISDALIPHWNAGTMINPTTTTNTVNWGESWPVAVALTLRGNGFVSQNYSSDTALRQSVLRLPDGTSADALIFLYSGLGGDGVRRDFGEMSNVLQLMSMSNVSTRFMPGGTNPWNSLWDPAWSGLPGFLCSHILNPGQAISMNANGTLNAPTTPVANLKMTTMSWILHELGHLAADFPDLYWQQYAPWGVWDIMSGPEALTHFPAPFASFLRNKAGWLTFQDKSREDHGIRLHPLESHNEAVRITNGAPGSSQFLVLENREELDYSVEPPVLQRHVLVTYLLDPHGRLREPYPGGTVRKITQVIGWGWAAGTNPGTAQRNALGELWWSIDQIADDGAGDLQVRLKLRALHLLSDFHRADWQGEEPGQPLKTLKHDFFSGSTGHVMLQDTSMSVQGISRGRVLYLHPRWAPNSTIRGSYDISSLGQSPFRLYAKLAMPDASAGSNGTTVSFVSGVTSYDVGLLPGEYKEVVFDFPSSANNILELVGHSGSHAIRDWIYILDGWLVPLPPVIYDFIAQASSAAWSSGNGALSFGVRDQPIGEASHRGRLRLHTGAEYGPQVLFTHPNWQNNGFVQGVYSNIQIPSNGAILRALVGFWFGRAVTGNGALISIGVTIGSGTLIPLVQNADVNIFSPGSTDPLERNDLTVIGLPLPGSTWGKMATFTIRIDAGGSPDWDWVSWPYLVLTST